MTNHTCFLPRKSAFALISLLFLMFACSDEQLTLDSSSISLVEFDTDAAGTAENDCSSCAYVVPAGVNVIDGEVLGLRPGDVIGLDARIPYGSLTFRNINGTLENPIVIRNCGGVARIDGTGKGSGLRTEYSSYYRITGGDQNGSYGIIVNGGTMGLKMDMLSTHFEIDHVEIQNSGFAGIMAKTDPSCNPATWRENFLMKGIAIRNNYIHDTGGEGIYAGHSFFMGYDTPCGVKLPHEIHYIRIFGNHLRNTGWDAIQLACATKGASIHANVIENYGVANRQGQNNGIQISAGTGGVCYNNLIKGGTGNGIAVFGLGDNVIHDNIIDHAGHFGVFCDERYTPGPGFKFLNNSILSPGSDGIRIYAELVPMNVIVNNIISNPGSYSSYTRPGSSINAFVHKLNADVRVEMSNNYFTMDTTTLEPLDSRGYQLARTCPVVDGGADISAYNIKADFYYKPRLKGAAYDIGAVEQY